MYIVECKNGNFEVEADRYEIVAGRLTFSNKKHPNSENIATFQYWNNVYCKGDSVKFIPHKIETPARSFGQGGAAASRRAVLKPKDHVLRGGGDYE